MLRPLQAAARSDCTAFCPSAGQPVQGFLPWDMAFKPTLRTDLQGASLHVAVSSGADDGQALASACRFITRPAERAGVIVAVYQRQVIDKIFKQRDRCPSRRIGA